jgi:hypothetical protein
MLARAQLSATPFWRWDRAVQVTQGEVLRITVPTLGGPARRVAHLTVTGLPIGVSGTFSEPRHGPLGWATHSTPIQLRTLPVVLGDADPEHPGCIAEDTDVDQGACMNAQIAVLITVTAEGGKA